MLKFGVFWKIQDICYQISTEIFKIEEEVTKKMKPKVANPPSKNGQNSLLSIYIDWSSQPFMRALWSLNLTHQAKGTKLPLLYLLQMCGTSFAFIASHENAEDHQRSAYCEQLILPIFGGGVGNFRLHFLNHFSFNFENLSAHVVANNMNFPKHSTFAFFQETPFLWDISVDVSNKDIFDI